MQLPVAKIAYFIMALFFAVNSRAVELKFLNIADKYIDRSLPDQIQLNEYRAKLPPELILKSTTSDVDLKYCSIDGIECSFDQPIKVSFSPGQRSSFYRKLVYSTGTKGETRTLKILTFDANIKSYQVEGKSHLDKNIIMTPQGLLLVLSSMGDVLFFQRDSKQSVDFKQHYIDGKIFYSYLRVDRGFPNVSMEGHRILLNENFELIKELSWTADAHDFLMLGKDHFIHFEYRVSERKHDSKCLTEEVIIETKSGKTVRQLSNLDVLKMGYLDGRPDQVLYKGRQCIKWSQLNSIQLVGKDHWLIGYGGSMFFYDFLKKTVDWILGGPEDHFIDLSDRELARSMYLMHTPVLDFINSTVTYFSNNVFGTLNGAKSASVIELKLNLKKRTVLSQKKFPIGDLVAPHSGGFVREGDIVSVAAGFTPEGQRPGPDFIEAELGKDKPNMTIKFESKVVPYMYRVYRGI